MTHPFPFIEELKDLFRIRKFQDILRIRDFVFSLIPWGVIPYDGPRGSRDVKDIYYKCKNNELFGWCGFNADFFKLLMDGYGVKCSSLNYGLNDLQISHCVEIVNLADRVEFGQVCSMEILIDIYFCKYYSYLGEFPLRYDELISFIREKKFNHIIPVYGDVKKKKVYIIDGKKEIFYVTPQELEKEVLSFFKVNLDLDSNLQKKYGDSNPLSLMQTIIPGVSKS